MSVSMLIIGNGAATPERTVNFSIAKNPVAQEGASVRMRSVAE